MGVVLALMFNTTAQASELLLLTGDTGDFGTHDSNADPGAKCGYSAADNQGFAYLRWIKVFPVFAGARDINGGVQDHQKVSWRVLIQRSGAPGGPWKTVARSTAQTRTAYDDVSAVYSPMKVYVSGKAGKYYRALSTLMWLRGGSVEGKAKLRMEYYSVKWTVGTPDYVFMDSCTGQAD